MHYRLICCLLDAGRLRSKLKCDYPVVNSRLGRACIISVTVDALDTTTVACNLSCLGPTAGDEDSAVCHPDMRDKPRFGSMPYGAFKRQAPDQSRVSLSTQTGRAAA